MNIAGEVGIHSMYSGFECTLQDENRSELIKVDTNLSGNRLINTYFIQKDPSVSTTTKCHDGHLPN